jgi:linoleoyl-CoA desaturase
MKASSPIKFASTQLDFFTTLNQRVNEHFKSHGITKHANSEMFFKTFAMFAIYFTPYILILTETVTSTWPLIGLCIVMGIGLAGIGLSVMHDANHGSYSKKPWVNELFGYSLNVVGGNAFNWKVQHNVLHHTYTNIHDVDEDISPRGILRMTPYGPWKFFHRFQHFYAWFFYGLMTLVWVIVKDFVRLGKYEKDGLVKKQKTTFMKEWLVMTSTKIMYFVYILVIPMLVLSFTWWQWLIGFIIMHYVAGFILAIIFQPAHVIDGTEYPLPDEEGKMENSWAIHQLHTTTNFANKNIMLSWYCGGLNFQVEHHLFPTICHVHYREISPIVQQTAKEFGLPYKAAATFTEALWLHAKMLKELGKKPILQVAR